MVLDPSFPEPEMPRTARALADGDLGRWMHWLLTAHVRRYQRHYHATGHVWQGRFKAFPAWFKSGLQLRGGWGRRPKGNAPRSEASALGARWLLPARSQPPNSRHLRGWQRGSSRPTPQ